MRCVRCDYPLWEIHTRQCPECGGAFVPSDFDFVPGSVRFCCPTCGQAYYGTTAKGHLEPPEFQCVGCGTDLHMDRMVLRPAEGVDERQTKPDRSPWQERASIGRRKALRRTFYRALIQPGRLARSLPGVTMLADSFWYAVLIAILLAVTQALPMIVLLGFGAAMGGGMMGVFGGILAAMVVAAFVGVLIGAVIWAGLAHLVLLITGPRAGGFARTLEVFFYSVGSNVLIIIPGCGWYVYWIWPAITAAVMLKIRQDVAWWRAIVGAMTIPAFGVVAMMAYIYWITTFMATATFTPGPVVTGARRTGMSANDVHGIMVGFQRYVDRTGSAPINALELLRDGDLSANDFIASNSLTMPNESNPFGIRLDLIINASETELGAILEQAAGAMTDNIVAHRVGDYVFTYHGVNLVHPQDPRLWLVVRSLDPLIQQLSFENSIAVATADGSIVNIDIASFSVWRIEQNSLRALHGLPPIPHPSKVRADTPAVAPD